MTICFFLIILTLTHLVNPVYAEDRALIIGVNKYQHVNPLNGSVLDAQNMQQLAKDIGGYQSRQIRLLTDLQATRQGILDGLKWLAEGTQPGDRVLFYFSGHGAQTPDSDGDEEDKRDETLCPVDATSTRRNMITDDEINAYLQQLKGRQVLFIVDACHSGTIDKGMALPTGVRLKTPIFDIPLPEEKSFSKTEIGGYFRYPRWTHRLYGGRF